MTANLRERCNTNNALRDKVTAGVSNHSNSKFSFRKFYMIPTRLPAKYAPGDWISLSPGRGQLRACRPPLPSNQYGSLLRLDNNASIDAGMLWVYRLLRPYQGSEVRRGKYNVARVKRRTEKRDRRWARVLEEPRLINLIGLCPGSLRP